MIKKFNNCPLKDAKFKDGTIVKNVSFRTLAFGEMTLGTIMYYKKGAVVPLHKHHHEQVGFVVLGKLKVNFNNQEAIIEKGDSYALQGNTEHSLEALEDSQIIDMFTPVRKEYLD